MKVKSQMFQLNSIYNIQEWKHLTFKFHPTSKIVGDIDVIWCMKINLNVINKNHLIYMPRQNFCIFVPKRHHITTMYTTLIIKNYCLKL